jgi:tRNA threonylcarbamoyladenosine biosynthesis protein TsaE
MEKVFLCDSPEETAELASKFGKFLSAGDVVLFTGDLGAGKTLFVKGIARALGVSEEDVSSPSFSLVNRYSTDNLDLFHIDLWRLSPNADFDLEIGLGEILEAENAVVLIEWAERLGLYPVSGRVFYIQIKGEGNDPRQIRIISHREEGAQILKEIVK